MSMIIGGGWKKEKTLKKKINTSKTWQETHMTNYKGLESKIAWLLDHSMFFF